MEMQVNQRKWAEIGPALMVEIARAKEGYRIGFADSRDTGDRGAFRTLDYIARAEEEAERALLEWIRQASLLVHGSLRGVPESGAIRWCVETPLSAGMDGGNLQNDQRQAIRKALALIGTAQISLATGHRRRARELLQEAAARLSELLGQAAAPGPPMEPPASR
jgi:hypothetical protein